MMDEDSYAIAIPITVDKYRELYPGYNIYILNTVLPWLFLIIKKGYDLPWEKQVDHTILWPLLTEHGNGD